MSKEGRYANLEVSRCWIELADGSRRCMVMVDHECRASRKGYVNLVISGIAGAVFVYAALVAATVALG